MSENLENRTDEENITEQSQYEVPDNTELHTEKQDKMTEEHEQNDREQPDLAEELASMQDKFLRLAAEYDNYQKRTQKERIDLIKNAGERTIKAFLPVVDDFNRMLLVMGQDETLSEVIKEGFSLIQQKFTRILSELGVKEIEAVGKKFDSAYHEAVGELPAPQEDQKGIILAEVEKGYFLNDKVLRYSKVLIGK
jgi:molecular chaperone GrpE